MVLDNFSIAALVLLLLFLAAVIYGVAFWPARRLRAILARPFPPDWLVILEQRLPFYRNLSAATQQQLLNLVKQFLHDKNFVGCAGQEINDDIRVTIAAQACLLLLNRSTGVYPQLQSVLVYPSTFLVTRDERDEIGLVSTHQSALLGESWDHGKVVLAWDNVENSVRDFQDGHNVVLHEFAHQLDSESGSDNGAPLLTTRGAYRNWARVFAAEFHELQEQAHHGEPSLLDQYGATNPAEFFAVATETFFERPLEMRAHHEELFNELKNYYQVDPTGWFDQ